MSDRQRRYQAALYDFREARTQAALQEILARLTGKSNQLLSYEQVAQKLRLSARSERGVQTIPIAAIVGSVGRYTDFTRTFLPRREGDRDRWARVKLAFDSPDSTVLPPIDVYQVGQAYFVIDGNHRVSIARQQGMSFIEAHVIEIQTPIPLTPDTQPDDLIIKAEYADFIAETHLSELRPGMDLSVTIPGQYAKLKEQILVQRYWLEQNEQRPISIEQAAAQWYDQIYLPIAEAIRERGILRWFPQRTPTDLYLWVSEHRETLQNDLGWTIRPEAAVTDLAVRESPHAQSAESTIGSWRKARMVDRYAEHLFADILVPLNGTPESWAALEQATIVAQREDAHIHGLHVAATQAQRSSPEVLALQDRFKQICANAGIAGNLAIEIGDITGKIRERALIADLVVLHIAHPPADGLPGLGSGLRTIIRQLARPLLAVTDTVSPFEHALLLYDGSPKSKEALFVATYLAERWKTALTVLTVLDGSRVPTPAMDYARNYLELHELQAEFIVERGPIDIVFKVMTDRQNDIFLMGGYSESVLDQIFGGSVVNFLLRESCCPLFICR